MAKGALKGDIKNHFQYRLWVYLLIAVAGWFAADLLYTVTAYRPPAERKVDFVLVQGGYPDTEALSAALSASAPCPFRGSRGWKKSAIKPRTLTR